MEPEIPLSIRLQMLWDRIRGKLSIQRTFLGMLDRLDERRGMRRARLDEGLWEVETGQAPDTRGVFRKAFHFLRLHWFLSGVCAVSIVAAAGLPSFRQWRCDRLIAGAEHSLTTGDWRPALDAARTALQIRPGDQRALWAAFRAQRALALPQALDHALKLLVSPGVSSSGSAMLELLQFLSGEDVPQGAFLAGYAALPAPLQQEAPFRALYARLQLRRGRPAAAEEILRSIPQHDSSPTVLLERLRFAISAVSPARLDEACRHFKALMEAGSALALPGLRLIAAVRGGVQIHDGFPDISRWLETNALASVEDQLIGWDQRWNAGESPEALVDEAVAKFGTDYPAEVCAWLNRHQRHADVVLLATPLEKRDAALTEELIEAQLALRLPAGLETLDAPQPGIDPAAVAVLRIRAALAGWTRPMDEAAWRKTSENAKAGQNQRALLELARLCRRQQRTAEMEEALAAAWQIPGGDLPVFADAAPLLESLAQRDLLSQAIAIMANFKRFETANPALNARYFYYQCLAGEATPTAVLLQFNSLRQEAPEVIPPEMTALLQLLAGDRTKARKVLEENAALVRRVPLQMAVLRACGTPGLSGGDSSRAGTANLFMGILPAEARRLQELVSPARAEASP